MKNCHMNHLATSQKTKIRSAFANNMPTNIKHSKAQISKMIQSGGFLHNMLSNLGKNVITDIAIPFARDKARDNLSSNAINKNKWKRSCQSRKRIYFVHFE